MYHTIFGRTDKQLQLNLQGYPTGRYAFAMFLMTHQPNSWSKGPGTSIENV